MKILLAFVLVAAVLAVPATAGPAAGKTLIATVGLHDAFKITLTLNGKKVTHLRPGTYTFVVHDDSSIHNFALGSQTANKRLFTTGILFKGVKRYRIKLAAGSYAYACSAHFQTMNGQFLVS